MEESETDFFKSSESVEKYVNETVKRILVLDHSKKPIKQCELPKYLSQKLSRQQWNHVLGMCCVRLQEMGLKLVEIKNASSKSFILVSNNYPLPSMYRFAKENEVADRTLLILVLTFIFMKEGNVSSDDIFNHLKDLGIYNEKQSVHEYFGDVKKKILNEFVSQLYLEKTVDKDTDMMEIKWGERAHAEVSKKSILEFVCKIGYEGAIQPKNLVSHYQIAMEEEKEGEDIDVDEIINS